MTLVQASFLAGLFGALAWLVGDILLVGFAPVTEEDLARYQAGGLTNLRLALYMRSGQTAVCAGVFGLLNFLFGCLSLASMASGKWLNQ